MDPNEQEADENLIKANDKEVEAEIMKKQGDTAQSSKMEGEVMDTREEAEQKKIDTESQINEAKINASQPGGG